MLRAWRHPRVTTGRDDTVTADPEAGAVLLNRWLDAVPRLTIDLGHRRLPLFRSLGVVGFQVALVVAVLASLLNGVPLVTALGLSAVAALSFFGWGLARRAVTGRETLVLIEYVWVALAAVAGFLWLSGGPIAAGLDVMAVGLCAFLAFGRIGCATAGCCHGVPADVGLAYGPEYGLPPRLTGRRLLPVQLVEAAGIALIGLVGLALVKGPPGRTLVWFLVAYAVLRFGCESLRGDARPVVLGLEVARVLCVVQIGIAVALAEAWLTPGPADRALVVGAAALLVAGVAALALSIVRDRNPLVAPAHLDETWELIRTLSGDVSPVEPRCDSTSLAMLVAVTGTDEAVHVSFSHPTCVTFPVGVALHPDAVVDRGAVTHLVLRHHDRAAVAIDYFARPGRSNEAATW